MLTPPCPSRAQYSPLCTPLSPFIINHSFEETMRFLLSVLHSSSLSSSARLFPHTAGHRQYMPITHTSSRLVPPYPLSTLHSHWRQREAATLEIFSYLVSVLSSPSIPSCFSHHAPQLLFLSLSHLNPSVSLSPYSTLSYPTLF